ncbi:HNH endonuclease [Micromonospora chersina]|uniref:HNH endonuclease n=1 Tax=Micromonospora chersina TaxID=47854 RepID=UPI00371BF871
MASELGPDAEVLAALYPGGVVRLWGSTPTDQTDNAKARALRGRRVGDHVLFYADSGFFARARIVHLLRNRAVAHRVWGLDENQKTWEHIMALDDVEEFPRPVPAEPILRALGVPVPLRSLTLAAPADYSRVAQLLPAPRQTAASSTASAAPRQRVRLSRADLFTAFERLSMHHLEGVPSRHQPLALLWAIGRLAAGESRLVEWRDFRAGVAPILQRFGRPESRVSPEHPFWHLRSSGLWEVIGLGAHPMKTPRLTLLEEENPPAGFTLDAANLLKDAAVRGRAVRTLLTRHLPQLDHPALLADVGLPGYDSAAGEVESQVVLVEGEEGQPSRREVTSQRIVRDPRVAQSVKLLYDHQCQVCGTRLTTVNGAHSQAAHIRGLGAPHKGPDHLTNMLCLCPNDHVLFDTFTIYIDRSGIVRSAVDQSQISTLRQHPQHAINPEHLTYHRQLCGRDE